MRMYKGRNSESGMISVDFAFATLLVFTLFTVFTALTLTLSVVSVSQYVGYSSSRAYYSGHFDLDSQVAAGQSKFQALLNEPALKGLYGKRTFLFTDPNFGKNSGYTTTDPEKDIFDGFTGTLVAKILEIKSPLFGNTFDSENEFSLKITSFLGREPTVKECQQFIDQRSQQLIDEASNENVYTTAPVPKDIKPFLDNGC